MSIFTEEQVKSLNEYQRCEFAHPFTCENRHDGDKALVATVDGFVCPGCDYVQNWAHVSMMDGSWVEGMIEIMAFNRPLMEV